MKKLSLVIPCYNEAKGLRRLVERTLQCALKRGLTPAEFELVIVDNGSKDGTGDVLRSLLKGPHSHFLHPVHVERNQGYGFGIFSGLRAATGDTLAWTHADLQCDPEDVFLAWEKEREAGGKCLVKGERRERALRDWLFSRAFELMAFLILGKFTSEINAQPKVFDRSLVGQLTRPPLGFSFDLYVLLRAKEAGWTIQTLPVRFPPRPHGQSHWASTFRSRIKTITAMLRFMWDYRIERIER